MGSGSTPAFLQQAPNPTEAGFYQLTAAAKQEPVRCTADLALPGNVPEALPLISGHVGLDRGPETLAAPAQVSLSVPDFSILGIGDVNSFLASQQACPAPMTHSESLSQ